MLKHFTLRSCAAAYSVRMEVIMFTKEDLIKQLSSMGAPCGVPVIVHSAYSRVGEVLGGGATLLEALIEYFTADGGLLLIPTHTWDLIGKRKITLDMTEKHTNLGYLSRLALSDARGVRTEHPTHSMVVFGAWAARFAECERLVETPTSPKGCYGKLYSMGGSVLLIGVTQTSNTYLHAVDEILGTSGRMEKEPMYLSVKRENGDVVSRKIYMFDESCGDISRNFDIFKEAFEYHGATRSGHLGDAEAILCNAKRQKEVVELIYSRQSGEDILKNGELASEKLYK